ncbi:MAG: hypothetical protein LBG48_00260 [Rickettsiales bacterium]|jgi:hypothetical protein|nr:hypothetical protein [Rickettsiales bacterium]
MNNLIILNNSFSETTNFCFKYLFWGYNKFFEICCDRPFVKGDVAKIIDVDSNRINVELVKNTKTLDIRILNKLPILIFLKTRIPHKVDSKYFPIYEKTSDFEVLQKQQVVMGQNKFYIYSLLVYDNCIFSTQDILYKHFDNFNIIINRNINNRDNQLKINNANLAKYGQFH